MTLDDLIRRAAAIEYPEFAEPLDAFCHEHQLPFAEFSEQFARQVAINYQEGRLGWLDADTAMNNLHLSSCCGLSTSAFRISPVRFTSPSTQASTTP